MHGLPNLKTSYMFRSHFVAIFRKVLLRSSYHKDNQTLHSWLNQIATLVLCNFSFVLLQAFVTFTCWTFISFKYLITIHWCLTVRIKPTRAYEDMRIYHIIKVVNVLYISVTFCGYLQGGVFTKDVFDHKRWHKYVGGLRRL